MQYIYKYNDENWEVRQEVAKRIKNPKLIKDDEYWRVRRLVAKRIKGK